MGQKNNLKNIKYFQHTHMSQISEGYIAEKKEK